MAFDLEYTSTQAPNLEVEEQTTPTKALLTEANKCFDSTLRQQKDNLNNKLLRQRGEQLHKIFSATITVS